MKANWQVVLSVCRIFSLSHTLAHSFANIAFSFICTIISFDVLVATNLYTCPCSDDIYFYSLNFWKKINKTSV